jgi:phosphatidylglycerol---prolipoprotein diacylglyceryl transferase
MTLPYPQIPPVIVSIGPFALRWYAVMYVVGYALGVRLTRTSTARWVLPLSHEAVESLVMYLVIGMLVGARLVYALVYDRPQFMADPVELVRVWHGGLSFHGALIGMTVACVLFAKRHGIPLLALTDLFALAGTPGLFFGRIGNFINAELYGRPSHVPWAMVFPTDPLQLPRHPSQLYEALGEGLLLSLVLWYIARRNTARQRHAQGLLSAVFLIGYGVVRFTIEFTREPDPQLGLVLGPFSMGQLLSFAMIVAGVVLLAASWRRGALAIRA